ncbi:MAG: glycoside hydrolase family 127 protein [Planctomycetes bacterium]|nr:glycoside hydrolase family 127 protein [Planctomycetota bacterium]
MRRRSVAFAVAIAALACAPSAAGEDALRPIDPRRVEVGGEIGRRIDVTIRNNLLAIDVDRDFLEPFRKKEARDGYVGIGKLIDSLVRFAAHTGDERVMARKDHVIAELLEAQESDGYIGIMREGSRMWPLWDIHEMSYIVYGLAAHHEFFGHEPSLAAARKLADFILQRWSAEPGRIPGGGAIADHMAATGFENAMLALYGRTKEDRYLDACTTLRKLAEWKTPIVLGRWGKIEGHAYAYLCRSIAQSRLDRIAQDQRLLSASDRVIKFLRLGEGLVITGTCGDHECWHDTQEGTINLGETCATAYLLRFWDDWLRRTGLVRFGDLMERAIYNALFAAQSPDGRRIRYYTPFDGPRSYFEGDTYCCPNNYRRIVAELPGMICYRADTAVTVNLYTACEVKVDLEDGIPVKIRQETDYPSSGKIAIRVDPDRPATFIINARVPGWCAVARASIDGRALEEKPGGWLSFSREWKAGDRIAIDLPMPLRLVKGCRAQAGRVAVMRGPLVYCLSRERNPDLADIDLRNIVIDPATLEGPQPDASVRPGGTACRVRAWKPGAWYPMAAHDFTLVLTEYPDPSGEAIYFKVPNPNAKAFVED